MKAPVAKTVLTVDFRSKGAPRPTVAPTGRVPRVVRLLALAHRIDRMIREGEIRDLAEAARRLGLTRARITQLMNLLLLAPAIQEAILDLPAVVTGRAPVTERQLRPIVAEPDWTKQIEMWRNDHGLAAFLSNRDGSGLLRLDRSETDPAASAPG